MIVIIPCYNEEHRLQPSAVARLIADPRIDVTLVDDGSRDGTLQLMRSLSERFGPRVRVLALAQNGGKAEAVRRGFLDAFAQIDRRAAKDDVVGYMDADFATPPEEMSRLYDEMRDAHARVALGSRIARLGAQVRRQNSRHYLGRVFATTASLVLDMSIYDTQCGAKLFRDSPIVRKAFAFPFRSQWVFDVELLGRLATGTDELSGIPLDAFIEVPLKVWEDVRGSKLGVRGAIRGGLDLLRLGARVRIEGRGAFFPTEKANRK